MLFIANTQIMFIRLYNYYELILVLCICLLVTYFHQQSLIITNSCLLLPTVFYEMCFYLSLFVPPCGSVCLLPVLGIICPFPVIGLRLFCPIWPSSPVRVRECWDSSTPLQLLRCMTLAVVVCGIMCCCFAFLSAVFVSFCWQCPSPLLLFDDLFTLFVWWGKQVTCVYGALSQ